MSRKITSWVKCRIAETLVERIFYESGYKIRLAATWKCASLEQMRKRNQPFKYEGDLPDYLISESSCEPEWLEVKYKHDGATYGDETELREQCQKFGYDPKTRFNIVLVTSKKPPYFWVVRSPYFEGVNLAGRIPIEEGGWRLNEPALRECERLIGAGIFNWR